MSHRQDTRRDPYVYLIETYADGKWSCVRMNSAAEAEEQRRLSEHFPYVISSHVFNLLQPYPLTVKTTHGLTVFRHLGIGQLPYLTFKTDRRIEDAAWS